MARSRKHARLDQAVKEVVSLCVLTQLRDPRVRGVTVIDAEVAADLRSAKVYVSVMTPDDEAAAEQVEKSVLAGLESSRGFLQGKVGDRLKTRNTPLLTFKLDDSVKRSIAVSRAVREAVGGDLSTPDPPPPEPFEFGGESAASDAD